MLIGQGEAATSLLVGRVGIDGRLAVVAEGDESGFGFREFAILQARRSKVFEGEAELPQIGDILRIDRTESPGRGERFAARRQRLGNSYLSRSGNSKAIQGEPKIGQDRHAILIVDRLGSQGCQ